jgi:hypothetical protein
MEGRVIYLGQMRKNRIPLAKSFFSKDKVVLGEVRRRESCYVKLTAQAPTLTDMRKIIDLAKKGLPRDDSFTVFVRRLIEAQGRYAEERLKTMRVTGRRLSARYASSLRRLLDAREAVFAAEGQHEREIADRRLRSREEEHRKQGLLYDPKLEERTTLTGATDDDLRVWRLNFPVGRGHADIPYELHIWVQDGDVVAEIFPRILKGPFREGSALAEHRGQYIVTLVRMALHGSLKRLVRCIVCKKFALRKRAVSHAFCGHACSRKHDSKMRHMSKLEKELATISIELQKILKEMPTWQTSNEAEKVALISYMRTRARITTYEDLRVESDE